MADENKGPIGSAAPAGMGTIAKIAVVATVLMAGCAAVLAKGKGCSLSPPPAANGGSIQPSREPASPPLPGQSISKPAAALPKLLDLGAGKCIPCKKMAPILEELKTEYAGKLDVVFIDVWQNSGAGEEYGIRLIPTQIFYGPDGKERFRHEGFFSKEDILNKWRELGFEFAAAKP